MVKRTIRKPPLGGGGAMGTSTGAGGLAGAFASRLSNAGGMGRGQKLLQKVGICFSRIFSLRCASPRRSREIKLHAKM